jgi:CHAT domain-containing protein
VRAARPIASLRRLDRASGRAAAALILSCGLGAAGNPPELPADVAAEVKSHTEAHRRAKTSGEYASAAVAARRLLELRSRHQPEPWWQTVAARVAVEDLDAILALPPESQAQLAATENMLADARRLSEAGRFDEALHVMDRQLAVRLELLPPNHTDIARSLVNTALDLHRTNQLDRAEERDLRALAIWRDRIPGDSPLTAQTLHNLAWLRLSRGDRAAAEPLYQEALAMRRRILPRGDAAILETLNSYASLLFEQGRLDEAEPLYREALEERQRLHPGGHADLAKSMKNMGELLAARAGRAGPGSAAALLDEAGQLFDDALAMRRQVLAPDHPDIALSMESVALLALRRGDSARAVALLEEGLGLARAALGERHASVAQLLADLGRAQTAAGRADDARRSYESALDIAEGIRTTVLGDERSRAAYAGRLGVREIAATLAGLHMDRGDVDAACGVLERGRSRALLDLLARSEVDLVAELERTQGEDAALRLTAALETVRAARDETARAESALASASAERRTLNPQDVERLRDLEARIASHEALVRSARRQVADVEAAVNGILREAWPQASPLSAPQIRAALQPGERLLVYSWASDRIDALIFSSAADAVSAAVTLASGPARVDELKSLVAGMRRSIASPSASGAEAAAASAAVSSAVLPPELAGPLLQAQRVVIVPDGPLHEIPFEALPWMNAGEPAGLLLEAAPDLVYASSGTLHVMTAGRVAATAPAPAHDRHRAVVLGNARFEISSGGLVSSKGTTDEPDTANSTGARARSGEEVAVAQVNALDWVRLHGGRLAPLPATEAEARIIARLLSDDSSADGTAAAAQVALLLGEEASIVRLEGALGCRFLHLATHGLTGSAARPYDASLALTRPAVPTADDIGFLTLERMIERWRGRLEGCELVVLSACDTQSGIERGDSVMALPWGFFYAGAQSVIASLWKVDDTATMLLMTRLYENLLGAFDGERRAGPRVFAGGRAMTRSDALREARMWLRSLDAVAVRAALDRIDGMVPGRAAAQRASGDRGVVRVGGSTEPAAGDAPYGAPYYWAAFVLLGRGD